MTDEEFLAKVEAVKYLQTDLYEAKAIMAGMEITPARIDLLVDHAAMPWPKGATGFALALVDGWDLTVPQFSKLFLRFPGQLSDSRNLKPEYIERILFGDENEYYFYASVVLAHPNCTDAMRVRYNLLYGGNTT